MATESGEPHAGGTQQTEYRLQGLSCAQCAADIEQRLKELPGVERLSLHFSTAKLTIEWNDHADGDDGTRNATITRVARQVEPDVVVQDRAEPADGSALRRLVGAEPGWERLAISAAGFLAVLFLPVSYSVQLLLALAVYALIGWDVIRAAVRDMAGGRLFQESFLMTIATAGALAIGSLHEAVAVMLFYQIGAYLQGRAVERSRRSISDLIDIRPDRARVERDGETLEVAPEEVAAGEIVLVRPGERVPVDGTVVEGESYLDTSAVTGESTPDRVSRDGSVVSGSINRSSPLRLRAERTYGESTVARILRLVEEASERKPRTEEFITKFARVYTPAVVAVAAALAVAPPLLTGAAFSEWLYRALVFLVISCPCALVVSIPLSFFASIGAASRRGVLVKGGNTMEALREARTVVFDKTGTLTEGNFRVRDVEPADKFTREDLLGLAAAAETHSNHPIASSIRDEAARFGVEPPGPVDRVEERAGRGVVARVNGKRVIVGSQALLEEEPVTVPAGSGGNGEENAAARGDGVPGEVLGEGGTTVYCAVDGRYAGRILVGDAVKPDSAAAVAAVRRWGARHVVMLTGDDRRSAETIGRSCGIDEVRSELLPDEKVSIVEELERRDGRVMFVGDGLNDAPVLMRADVGVAMGGIGSDAAIEAADVVLMTDEPSRVAEAMRLARRTHRIVWQNIAAALGVKGAVLLAGAVGLASMWAAVFADVGVTLLAVANAMRLLHGRAEVSPHRRPLSPSSD